ncbi:hypothetical protein HK104_001941 [Borealophlyctis nickersoniae]|nr:hypothetical protein HK104_001941 [Borealophlyctis nickersoniae]
MTMKVFLARQPFRGSFTARSARLLAFNYGNKARLSAVSTPSLRRTQFRAASIGAAVAGIAGATMVWAKSEPLEAEATVVEESASPIGVPTGPRADEGRALGNFPKTLNIGGIEMPVVTTFHDQDMADLDKPRLVILGSGWAATSILKDLQPNGYREYVARLPGPPSSPHSSLSLADTIVVSPNNYFLFTPLLPEAASGTVEARSLLESIRKISKRCRAAYCEGDAYDVHFEHKMVEVVGLDGKHFLVPYDRLVISVGAQNNTFGVPGVKEHAHFLKTIQDARKLRYKLMNNFEIAALPTTSKEERKQLLSFVIAGGGPTGVEYAGELYDFLYQDLVQYFPHLLEDSVQVSIIQSGDHILNTFSEAISIFAEQQLQRENINVITNARVIAVEKDKIIYKKKGVPPGEQDIFEIPFGLCVWSTGITMTDFTKRVNEKIPQQHNKRALEVDSRLRLRGVDDVYALGDCATIENPKLMEILSESLKRLGCERLTYQEFVKVVNDIVDRVPQSRLHFSKLKDLFSEYDIDKDNTLDIAEIERLLKDIDNKLTSLPATAQVASQEGRYLAKKFNNLAYTPLDAWRVEENALKPFHYHHMGSFSYVGGENAVVDLGDGWVGGGLGAYLLWRGAYLSKQVSFRTRALLAFDWTKRDITRS